MIRGIVDQEWLERLKEQAAGSPKRADLIDSAQAAPQLGQYRFGSRRAGAVQEAALSSPISNARARVQLPKVGSRLFSGSFTFQPAIPDHSHNNPAFLIPGVA
jgi:hypothetical protein